MSNQLIFNNTPISVINQNDHIWISSAELAKALRYTDDKSVSRLFLKNQDEFTDQMTKVFEIIDSVTSLNLKVRTRIFSLRGAHLIAMFSRTKIAKDFRKWVLDILDKETEQALPVDRSINVVIPREGRWLVAYQDGSSKVINIDGHNCVDANLFSKLQHDSAFFAKKLNGFASELEKLIEISQNFAARTRITHGECGKDMFNIPLKNI